MLSLNSLIAGCYKPNNKFLVNFLMRNIRNSCCQKLLLCSAFIFLNPNLKFWNAEEVILIKTSPQSNTLSKREKGRSSTSNVRCIQCHACRLQDIGCTEDQLLSSFLFPSRVHYQLFPNKQALRPHFPYPSSVVNISFSVRYDISVSSGNDDGIDSAFIIVEDRHREFWGHSAVERRSLDQSVTRTHHSIGQFRALRNRPESLGSRWGKK